jgi:hypothetical protein
LAAQISGSRKMRRAACWSAIAGSLLTRYGWMQAGHASAKNWRLPLQEPQSTPERRDLQSTPGRPQMRAIKTG